MSVFLQVVDILACWALMLVALVSLASNAANTWRQVIGSLGLLLMLAGCFIGAVVIWETGHRAPWAVMQRVGCAVVAIWIYDMRFGWRRQARLVMSWAKGLPDTLRARWTR